MNEADGKKDVPATEHVGAIEEAADAPAGESTCPDTGSGADAAPDNEAGGPSGPEPTRFGDWERKGRCIDF